MNKFFLLILVCSIFSACSSGGWVVGNGLTSERATEKSDECSCAGKKDCGCGKKQPTANSGY